MKFRFCRCVLSLPAFRGFCLGLAAAQAQDQPRQQHVGRVLDWSYHHVILSGGLPAADLNRAKAEPRILFRLAERNLPRALCDRRRTGVDGDRDPVSVLAPRRPA